MSASRSRTPVVRSRRAAAPRRTRAAGSRRPPASPSRGGNRSPLPSGPAGAARPRTAVRGRHHLAQRSGPAWLETHPHGPRQRPDSLKARRRAGPAEAVEDSGASPARPAPLPHAPIAPPAGDALPPPRRAATSRGSAAPSGHAPHGRATRGLTVRAAVAGDLEPLLFFFDTALRRDYFLRRGQLADMLRGPNHQVYVAEIDMVLVGVAVTTRGARLVNALVHPAYRGLGIGRRLVEASAAREVRAKLDMSSGDPRGFYRSLGFAETGEATGKDNIALLRR